MGCWVVLLAQATLFGAAWAAGRCCWRRPLSSGQQGLLGGAAGAGHHHLGSVSSEAHRGGAGRGHGSEYVVSPIDSEADGGGAGRGHGGEYVFSPVLRGGSWRVTDEEQEEE